MINEEQVLKLYDESWSTHEIAKHFDTYPNKINRIIKKNGREVRSRSDAQRIALKEGKMQHPTKGTKRPERVKRLISNNVHDYWDKMSDKEKERRSKISKANWEAMSDSERDEMKAAASEAMRVAAKEGSKAEKFLLDQLQQNGYNVVFHKKKMVADENLEVDIYLPELNVVIEIDGPTHFLPIWGEDVLQKVVRSDAHKTGLLLQEGIAVIRVKYITKSSSKYYERKLYKTVSDALDKIKLKFPEESELFIELEVS